MFVSGREGNLRYESNTGSDRFHVTVPEVDLSVPDGSARHLLLFWFPRTSGWDSGKWSASRALGASGMELDDGLHFFAR